ncbi:Peptidase S46 [Novipirellula aureliae]|uniref:Peptidase S46 n=1 Tax=Novipirellula aureliae TaxID=2527966 RepID=A0A5C6DN70_9BACT|nr:S46 family peptidase [Novipirellula aureliae]TWU38713.1 Peptidase S46 [Novipirellula aureliae]
MSCPLKHLAKLDRLTAPNGQRQVQRTHGEPALKRIHDRCRCNRVLTILAMSLLCNIALGEEGMYPMSELQRLDLKERGIELTAAELFNPEAISLVDGVCRVNGCTGSFVSPEGLIITNHHCAYGAIQKASTAEHDYLEDGFQADSRAEEIPAPDYTVRVTEDYRDVSDEVLRVVTANMDFLQRTQAIEKRCKELEAAAEAAQPELRAEVAEMFVGKTYVLFQYTYLKDIRLVFAPPQSIGNFGGEADNWMWPRHTGDFSFMRAYTAPDGSSAPYSPENVPYRPKRSIQVSAEGVVENDAVFLLGYPGRTARHKTAAFLNYEQNTRLPTIVELYNWQIDVMTEAGNQDRGVEIQHASRMRSLANTEKRSRGQLQGLIRADIAATRAAEETKLQAYIEQDAERKRKYGHLLCDIASVYDEIEQAATREILLSQLRSGSRIGAVAYFLFDAAVERTKPDLERESEYMDRNWQQSTQTLLTSLQDIHQPTEAIILAGLLERLKAINADQEIPALAESLADQADLLAYTTRLTQQSRLNDRQFVQSLLDSTPQELQQADDPMLSFIVKLHPLFDEIRRQDKAREGKLSELYGSLIDVKQQYLSANFVPDANATLRFTCGYIRRYSPEDAVIKLPITTLSGVIDKTTGVAPFITPEPVLSKYAQQDFGPFKNEQLGDVPVAILYNTDTTGGNSGSPIFNATGELVGVNFDRCFEATINDFAWDESYSRSIGVDIRYVLWITGIAYGANHLLEEMNVPYRQP